MPPDVRTIWRLVFHVTRKDIDIMAILREKFKGKWRYRWQAYYTDPAGKRKRKSSKWFLTKREAEEDLALFQEDPKKESRSRRTVGSVYEDWVEFTAARNVAETTKEKRRVFEYYLSDLADVNIYAVTPLAIKEVFDSEAFQSLSTSRKNKLHGYLKAAFDYAMTYYDLPANPMAKIPRFQKTTEERLSDPIIYTPEQFSCFLEALDPDRLTYRNLFFLLYWTGLRFNEAASLTFKDCSQSKLRIHRQWNSREKKWSTLKTVGSVRTVSLDDDLNAVIQSQLDQYRYMPKFSEDWFVFGGPRPVSYTTSERVKNQACDSAGLPRCKIHSFRHAHASNLIAKGVPLFMISKRLGHASVSMTSDIYGHLLNTDDDEILRAIAHK